MVTRQMSGVIHHLCSAALTDGQLVERFITDRDSAALATLVRRHGPMVWGVCRRILRNQHDAEDAFQATFLVLARRAAAIVPREMVANWLYGVAYQTALKARATAAKRNMRERQVTQMPEPAMAEHDLWRDVRPWLDQELSRLPDKFRVVIVLCDLEGKTRKEAARQLGMPEGTVAGWLARARALLAKRLSRQGIVVPAAVLGAVVSHNVASAGVPASLVSSTIHAASALAAGPAVTTGTIPLQVAALTEGVHVSTVLSRAKLTMSAALVFGLAAIGWAAFESQAAVQGERFVAQTLVDQPGPAAPAKAKKVELPTTPAPVQVLASIDKDNKLVIKTNIQLPGDVGMQFGQAQVGGGGGPPRVQFLPPVLIGDERTRTYDLDKVAVSDTQGKKLDQKEVMKRLKEETLALASLQGEPVHPQHLRLIKDGTLVFVLPAPEGGPGEDGVILPPTPSSPVQGSK